jgi:hypothetical protein
MAIGKVAGLDKMLGNNLRKNMGQTSFKDVLEQKKVALAKEAEPSFRPSFIQTALKDAYGAHRNAVGSVENTLNRKDFKPAELLKIQFITGSVFLNLQFFSKTTEAAANTLKNFSQMQV